MTSEEMKALMTPIENLEFSKANANTHPRSSIEAIKNSLRQFGWQSPIIVDQDGVVIAGNGRLEAAMELGLEMVPVAVFNGPPEAARAFAISDNRSAQHAKWDAAILDAQLSELQGSFDLENLGFFENEAAEVIAAAMSPDEKKQKPGKEKEPVIVTCPACGHMHEV